MTEKIWEAAQQFTRKNYKPAKDTFLGEYTIYNSSIENYSFALNCTGRGRRSKDCESEKGVVSGYRLFRQMLDTFKVYTLMFTRLASVWLVRV